MVVNPQQHMHQTVHTINNKSNSRFTVKEGHGAYNLDATQNWSIANSNEFVSKYTEGVIAFQCSRRGLYMNIRISSRIWWVVLIIGDGDAPSVKGENDVHPRFKRLRVAEWIEGHNVLLCGCGYFHRVDLPCKHIFHMKGDICLTNCNIWWYKSYTYNCGWIPRYTHKISQIFNRVKGGGVPFVTSPPTINAPVYTNCIDLFHFEWVMKAPTPIMMDDCFPERLNDDSDDEFNYEFVGDGEMAGEYASLFTPQQSTTEYAAAIQLATTPQNIKHHPPLPFPFPLGSLHTPHQFHRIGSGSK
jgi:hypothetical protein